MGWSIPATEDVWLKEQIFTDCPKVCIFRMGRSGW